MAGSVPVGRATAATETTESLTMAGTSMPPTTLRSTAAPSTSLGEALSIVALGATPSTPYALCAAAMVPATCVPAASTTALASDAVVCGCSVRTSEPVTVL